MIPCHLSREDAAPDPESLAFTFPDLLKGGPR